MVAEPKDAAETALDIYNDALARLGLKPIASFDASGIEARTGNLMFNNIVEATLGDYPWVFARRRVKLSRVSLPSPAPWTSMFSVPSDTYLIVAVYEGQQKVLFDRIGSRIVTMSGDEAEVYADVTKPVDPADWPAYFRSAFIEYLAGVIAMPITQDERTAAFHVEQGERAMMRAKSRDSQGRSPRRIDTKLFIRSRRGGRR